MLDKIEKDGILSISRAGGIEIPNIFLIKDLAKLSGYSIHTIKYYLKIGLIKEVDRSLETNFRYFDNSTLETLKKIRNLRRENKSIKAIKDELL